MAFCGKCGADAGGGAFCPKCGAPVAAAPPPAQAPGGYPPYTPPPPGSAAAGLQDNMAAALCYVLGLVTGILFLVLQPYNQNKTIRFHAFQSIFFNIAWIILWWGIRLILGLLGYGAWGLMFTLVHLFIGLVIGFGGFLLWLFLMWRAYNNNPLVLPIIGPMAQQQAGK
jgi:uncharacterized membrane protein